MKMVKAITHVMKVLNAAIRIRFANRERLCATLNIRRLHNDGQRGDHTR